MVPTFWITPPTASHSPMSDIKHLFGEELQRGWPWTILWGVKVKVSSIPWLKQNKTKQPKNGAACSAKTKLPGIWFLVPDSFSTTLSFCSPNWAVSSFLACSAWKWVCGSSGECPRTPAAPSALTLSPTPPLHPLASVYMAGPSPNHSSQDFSA